MSIEDFTTWTDDNLAFAYRNMNRTKFPARFEAIEAELKRRGIDPSIQISINATSNASVHRPHFANPGRRFVAGILDMVSLTVLALLFFPFSSWINQMGWAAVFGPSVITFFYFGFFESSYGRGQSVGKRLLNIRLLRVSGGYVSVGTAIARAVIITGVDFAAKWNLVPGLVTSASVFSLAVGILAVAHLISCFVHPQHRGLVDLLFGTVVVDAKVKEPAPAVSWTPRSARIIAALAALLIVLVVSFEFGLRFLISDAKMKRLESMMTDLQRTVGPEVIGVNYNTQSLNGNAPVRSLIVTVMMNPAEAEDPERRRSVNERVVPATKNLVGDPAVFETERLDMIYVVIASLRYVGFFPVTTKYTHAAKISEILR